MQKLIMRRTTAYEAKNTTGGCTILYAMRAYCRVCNTHVQRHCETMAEWVMFDLDLWNSDGLSSATFFWVPALNVYLSLSGEVCSASAVKKGLSLASNMRRKRAKFLPYFLEKALQLGGFLRNLVSRIQCSSTRKEIRPPFASLHGDLRVTYRQTERQLKVHGTSRRLRPLSVIL